jgi:predicted amidohydrolase YtcJ
MLVADLVIHNGNLITLDNRQPRASAMAVRNGGIVYVGDDRDAIAHAGPNTRRIDLAGKTVTPGFIDCHIHLMWYGHQLFRQADLVGCAHIDDLLARLSQLASRFQGWIVGHGFDQDLLRERRFPTRDELDRVSRERPILISRVCGHAVVVNSAMLALASDEQRGAGDQRSGLYTEAAAWSLYRHMPPLRDDEAEQAILLAADVALRSGITGVHTLLDTPDQMRGYTSLHRQGRLPIRVVAMPPYAAVESLHRLGIRSGFGDDTLRFGACKIFADGSLGAQTALLSQPYADKPETCGIRFHPPDELKRMTRDAQARGFQLAIHAIGDQAVQETIDAIEFAMAGEPNEIHRHRIEHVSLCTPQSLERLAKLKIVASCQPQFVTSDRWTASRLGPARSQWAYRFKSFQDAGVPISLGSDCPVETLDAFACLGAATTRAEWTPDETLTMEDSIRYYCHGSAYAAHMEDRLGSLEPGKHADFVVLSEDPTRVGPRHVAQIRAVDVFVAGRRHEHAAQKVS